MPPSSPSPSEADRAWDQMLGKPTSPVPSSAPAQPSSPAPSRPRQTPPIAAAAKWGAIAVLGLAAIIAVVWVITTNRTRPTITPAPTPAPGATTPDAPSPSAATGSQLDLNTATAAQLEHLPGIGPALASRIVTDRSRHGRFNSVDELDRVDGIGRKTIEKLRPYLMVK